MKKFIKVLSIIFLFSFVICACKNEEEPPIEEPPEKTESTELKNIKTTEVRMFNGEFNDKTVVLKVNNDNTKQLYLQYSFEMYDKNKIKLYNKEVFVRVGKKDSAYVVAIQDQEESSFESYSYSVTVLDDELVDYDIIKYNIKSSYQDNGKTIIATLSNQGKRTTTAYGLLLFYKSNSLVAVKTATAYNLLPYQSESIEVDYPIIKINQRISYDRIEFVVNEVSTEL